MKMCCESPKVIGLRGIWFPVFFLQVWSTSICTTNNNLNSSLCPDLCLITVSQGRIFFILPPPPPEKNMMFTKKKRKYKREEVENGGKGDIFTVLFGENIIFEKGGGKNTLFWTNIHHQW